MRPRFFSAMGRALLRWQLNWGGQPRAGEPDRLPARFVVNDDEGSGLRFFGFGRNASHL
jgi:hypothetical protein